MLPPSDSASGANEGHMDHGSMEQECIQDLMSTVYNVDADKGMVHLHLQSSAEVVYFIRSQVLLYFFCFF